MKVLLTGSEGYIGSVLGPYLLRRGHDVVGLDTGYHRVGWLVNGVDGAPQWRNKDTRHVELDGDQVAEFSEKPQVGEGWINGGFFVLEPQVLDYIDGEETHFQKEPLERLAKDGQLMALRHTSFWQCMDTLRDKILLQQLWDSEQAPWKVWS